MTVLTAEEFIARFFSAPNTAWPGADPNLAVSRTLQPFLEALAHRGECPLILPRRDAATTAADLYVICWDTAHAGRIRPLIEAAVAYHWCRFDGRVARLDPADPVQAAVLDLVGPGATFVLRPTAKTARPTFTALSRLILSLGGRPLCRPVLSRPVGRMLREFELALAGGAAETSASLLREIEAVGGISHENVAFLQLRRLAHLGRYKELLEHSSLPTVVYAEPPRLVRQEVLTAWARAHLPDYLASGDITGAIVAIRNASPDVAMLVDQTLADTVDPDLSTICALVALARGDRALARLFVENPNVAPPVLTRLLSYARTVSAQAGNRSIGEPMDGGDSLTDAVAGEAVASEDAENRLSPAGGTPESAKAPAAADEIRSWLEWISRLGGVDRKVPDRPDASAWESAWSMDTDLAEAIDDLPEFATDDLLSAVTVFIETEDPDRPAHRTAVALLSRYLVEERFSPNDLGAISALLDTFLRGAPPVEKYREVLLDVRAFAPQWVGVGTATRVLDIADVVVCGPASDAAARADFVTTLLSPLNQQKRRLSAPLRRLAELVSGDVDLEFDWSVQAAESAGLDGPVVTNPRILLYSLDGGTLARVEKVITLQWPDAHVSLSSDKVGNPSLKQNARNADLIVIATRRAAHAATGFIVVNATTEMICYPDGAGSASMLRAVEDGLARASGK